MALWDISHTLESILKKLGEVQADVSGVGRDIASIEKELLTLEISLKKS